MKLLSKSIIFGGIITGIYFTIGGCGGYYPSRSTSTTQPPKSTDTIPNKQTTTPVQQPIIKKTPQQPSAGTITSSTQQESGSYMSYPAMKSLMDRMMNKGFSRAYLHQTFANIKRDDNILAKVKSPAEAKPWKVYRPIFLTEPRIRSGVGFWKHHQAALNAAEKKYGVDPEYIVAIIGVETLYGRNTGKHNVLRSLTTLAMDFPKRSKFYTSELEQFLLLTREERINTPANVKGSYAGAMGLGQFISSSYRNFAVDFNGDKHKDLWHPVDAIGSVANYLSRHGWQHHQDVAVPTRIEGTNYVKIAHTKARKPLYSLHQLAQYGVKPRAYINSTRLDLLRLQGSSGDEYWVTGDNFYTITRYNHSPKYAMAVYQLAQEIKRRKLAN